MCIVNLKNMHNLKVEESVLLLFFFIEVWLIYNAVQSLLYSKVTQLYTSRHSFFIFFSIMVYLW